MDNALALTGDNKKKYMDVVSSWSSRPTNIPEIKISYKDDETYGKFIKVVGGQVTDLGKEISGVILKVRYKYQHMKEGVPPMYTSEISSFQESLCLFNGSEIIEKSLPYKEMKVIIKRDYPEMKYYVVLYVMVSDMIYKLVVGPSSRQELWDYQASTSGQAPFEFFTKFQVTGPHRKGAVSFFAMSFERQGETPTKQFFEAYLKLEETLQVVDKIILKRAEEEKEEVPDIIEPNPAKKESKAVKEAKKVFEISDEIKPQDLPF